MKKKVFKSQLLLEIEKNSSRFMAINNYVGTTYIFMKKNLPNAFPILKFEILCPRIKFPPLLITCKQSCAFFCGKSILRTI
jgi:hypothetical protein